MYLTPYTPYTLHTLLILTIASLAADLAVAQHKAKDRTVGACTRKAEFAERQAAIDPLIQELVQAADEDKAELGRAIAKKYGLGQQIECLIRYREPDMRHVFVPLLEAKHWPTRARALYGLKMVGGKDDAPAVLKCMQDSDARVREMVANCLCHIGEGSAPVLKAALAEEKDPRVCASLSAAIKVLESGEQPYRPWKEELTGPASARRVAWAWTVKGKRAFNEYDAKALEYPRAGSLSWPISWYEGSLFGSFPRKSFGGAKGHTGEDMAWFREGCSVFAIADGIVRMVQGAGGNWGFVLLVEHQREDGQYFCSLYGHLGWDVLVKPGDVVKKGQKIATVGLSCSVENGGYGAHLHFGVADGPFRKPKGIYKDGTALNFDYKGKRVKAPVIAYVYMPKRPDKNGFPGLGLKVRLPDGEVLEVHVGNVTMPQQVGWITGYRKGCRGWFDPYKYITARLEPKQTEKPTKERKD
ncbi:MAG: peptidoglycan DD-metalloendopeptidase family protein [Planctomycetota bacterium]|jgi:murein DD-endopeptidase MepM/ murein hydrolase activator NlpD